MAAAKLFHSAGQQVTVPTYLVPATQKVLLASSDLLARPFASLSDASGSWIVPTLHSWAVETICLGCPTLAPCLLP